MFGGLTSADIWQPSCVKGCLLLLLKEGSKDMGLACVVEFQVWKKIGGLLKLKGQADFLSCYKLGIGRLCAEGLKTPNKQTKRKTKPMI